MTAVDFLSSVVYVCYAGDVKYNGCLHQRIWKNLSMCQTVSFTGPMFRILYFDIPDILVSVHFDGELFCMSLQPLHCRYGTTKLL